MNASWITCPRFEGQPYRAPWSAERHNREDKPGEGKGLPAFRRTFSLAKSPSEVTIEASALGVYDLFCNGIRVGTRTPAGVRYDELKPGPSDYRETVYTDTYSLMPYLARENTVVAVVSSGWWSGNISFGSFGNLSPAFAAEITLTYPDGEKEIIRTDAAWESTVAGPVLFADLYDGETVDARLPHPASPLAPYTWGEVSFFEYSVRAVPQMAPPVRVREDLERAPISATVYRETEDNGTEFGAIRPRMKRVGDGCECVTLYAGEHLILDLGQNMVGRPRITLSAASGTRLTVRVAEMCNDTGSAARGNDGAAGTLYLANYRTAHALIGYTACGADSEICLPVHTFYGFRYLELEVTDTAKILAVAGEVLTSDLSETSHIETDNAEVNRLISNIEWGRRSNYLFIPTDCPQRDERLGWSGDTQIFSVAAAYLCDVRSFFRKWLSDARDSQKAMGGAYPDVVPHVLKPKNFANAGWGDACVILPGLLFRMYGDTETMREHYASMEWYMDFLDRFGGTDGGNVFYGDWLSYDPTDKRYIAMAYYAYDARLMESYSRILEKPDRARHYRDLFDRILAAWREKYVDGGEITEKTQTAYLLALRFHLVSGEEYERAGAHLAEKIRDNDHTLSTGFIGTGILAQTLSEIGEDNLAYSLLLQTRDPSWLYSVRQGATTVWERWNSYTKENGFGQVSMNSFNHYAYGAVLEWLFAGAAGIRPDEDGSAFEHFVLAPRPDTRRPEEIPAGQNKIRAVTARYDSVRGRIESAWHFEGETFVYRATVPANTVATVCFPLLSGGDPDPDRDTVEINGVRYRAGELSAEKSGAVLSFELPAGRYEIR